MPLYIQHSANCLWRWVFLSFIPRILVGICPKVGCRLCLLIFAPVMNIQALCEFHSGRPSLEYPCWYRVGMFQRCVDSVERPVQGAEYRRFKTPILQGSEIHLRNHGRRSQTWNVGHEIIQSMRRGDRIFTDESVSKVSMESSSPPCCATLT